VALLVDVVAAAVAVLAKGDKVSNSPPSLSFPDKLEAVEVEVEACAL
jgi:hypothetical protein